METLSKLPNLIELNIEGNPCATNFYYKYDILFMLKLQILDGEVVHANDFLIA